MCGTRADKNMLLVQNGPCAIVNIPLFHLSWLAAFTAHELMNLLCLSETAVKPQLWVSGADDLAEENLEHPSICIAHVCHCFPYGVVGRATCTSTNVAVRRHEPDSHLCDKSWTVALQSLADDLDRIKQVIRRSRTVKKESHFTRLLRTCRSLRKRLEMEYAD